MEGGGGGARGTGIVGDLVRRTVLKHRQFSLVPSVSDFIKLNCMCIRATNLMRKARLQDGVASNLKHVAYGQYPHFLIIMVCTVRQFGIYTQIYLRENYLMGKARLQDGVASNLAHIARGQLPHLGSNAVLLHQRLLQRKAQHCFFSIHHKSVV